MAEEKKKYPKKEDVEKLFAARQTVIEAVDALIPEFAAWSISDERFPGEEFFKRMDVPRDTPQEAIETAKRHFKRATGWDCDIRSGLAIDNNERGTHGIGVKFDIAVPEPAAGQK